VAEAVAASSFGIGQPNPPLPPGVVPLFAVDFTSPSMTAGAADEVFYGTFQPGSLGVIRRLPVVSAEVLVPPTPQSTDARDLEWIAPAAPPANQPPLAAAGGPYVVPEGAALTLDGGASSDPDGDAITGSWSFRAMDHAGLVVQLPAEDDFAGPATLHVQDGRGGTATATADVTIENVAPAADAGPDRQAYWGQPLAFDGSATDPGVLDVAAGLQAEWTFGDGASAAGFAASHAYASPGSYTALLTARDKDGGAGGDGAAVVIEKRPTTLVYTGPLTLAAGAAPLLRARLGDVVDGPTARLAGRTVRFVIEGTTLAAVTDAEGSAEVQGPALMTAGTVAVGVSFLEDADYLASATSATLQVTGAAGKVTGGGRPSNGGQFGFNVHGNGTQVWGELQYRRGSCKFHAHTVNTLTISADRKKAWFSGVGRDGRPFNAYVEDNGEPGTADVFRIWIAGVEKTGNGRFTGGNIQIH
jgi:hypothetical protein